MQLHRAGIAHMDVKPSNVLVYPDTSKIADLGRASARGMVAPHDDDLISGDLSYAPPELHYSQIDPDWNRRRLGCDVYLLGSLATFLFTGASMTGLIASELDPSHHWNKWTGTYQEVLPYVRDAFGRAIATFEKEVSWPDLSKDLTIIVRELCDPDPAVRGHPANRAKGTGQYSLEQYVSRFDVLAKKLEMGLL